MSVAVTDVNKSVIMKMLQTDVFGFSAEDIEQKAKEIHNIVVNGDEKTSSLKMVGGYGRTESGNIAIFYNGFFNNKDSGKPSKGKKK